MKRHQQRYTYKHQQNNYYRKQQHAYSVHKQGFLIELSCKIENV